MRDEKIKLWEKSLSHILIIKLSPSPICMANFFYLSVSNLLPSENKKHFEFSETEERISISLQN